MENKCRIRITREDYEVVINHLFPGDMDEHGAVLLAGTSKNNGQLVLHVREIHLAREEIDYIEGKIGYRALSPTFIHRMITRARDERLVYLAVHNHGSDRNVDFSNVDLESHVRGYPALLQIAKGMPVGALVFGKRSVQADIWLPDGSRLELDEAVVVGTTINRLFPSPKKINHGVVNTHDRQIKMFGTAGQMDLKICKVAIIGLGGIGSLIAEYLARLGVGNFYLVDDDCVEESNLSRIVGATLSDVKNKVKKIEVAQRIILQANNEANIKLLPEDVAKGSVANKLISCDYLFLAADSMRARLVFNAIVHQYIIPGVQLGSKIRSDMSGKLLDVMSANRPVRPGLGCLWCNQLIDSSLLAKEAKTDEERKSQAYGVEESNPSVISLNAISAAHAVNDFLLDYLTLRPEKETLQYEHYFHLKFAYNLVIPRKSVDCSECSRTGLRFGRGDLVALPCLEG